jgi:dipeptidyl aminopeptidase/acylaminoacyl peptidase
MSARIRAGIQRKRTAVPWWRRPQVAFAGIGGSLALVAGVLLAFVLINGQRDPVGVASPTASVETQPSATAVPTLAPPPSTAPSITPPSATATPTQPAASASPEPQVFLALTGPVEQQELAVRDGQSGDTVTDVIDTPSGEPIAAELSPDGQWLAYITVVGETGLSEVRATRIGESTPSDDPDASPPPETPFQVGETALLGESVAGGPFLERLSWSPDGRYLAYTLVDPDGGGADAWIFQPALGDPEQLTETGTAYAGSWAAGDDGSSYLWVSTAADRPRSDVVKFDTEGGSIEPVDPTESTYAHADNVFMPMVSPDGGLVIFWSGRMDRAGEEWEFVEGGAPWLAENTADGAGGFEFTSARELFADVVIGRDAFSSAAITWGADSDTYAVWDARWTGRPQAGQGSYPDAERVYFGHARNPGGLTWRQAIDVEDIPEGARVVDVKVSPTGRHLVITAAQPRAGVLDTPRADLLLITRNLGTVADDVEVLGPRDQGWFGPAAFDRAP